MSISTTWLRGTAGPRGTRAGLSWIDPRRAGWTSQLCEATAALTAAAVAHSQRLLVGRGSVGAHRRLLQLRCVELNRLRNPLQLDAPARLAIDRVRHPARRLGRDQDLSIELPRGGLDPIRHVHRVADDREVEPARAADRPRHHLSR